MKELKLLHTGDFHLDSPFSGLKFEDAEKRRIGQRKLLFSIADLARRERVHAVLISGDVFDNDGVANETVRAFNKAFGSLNMPIFVIAGNHDYYDARSPWLRFKFCENMVMFKSNTMTSRTYENLGARFWGASFVENNSASQLKDFVPPEKSSELWDIMLLHCEISSGYGVYNPTSRRQIENSKMDYIAMGHIHSPSQLAYGGKTAYAYSGTIEGRGFDETGDMGVNIISLSNEGVQSQFIPLGGVRYENLEVDIEGGDPVTSIMSAIRGLSKHDHCRISLVGETKEAPDLQKLYSIFGSELAEIVLLDNTDKKENPWQEEESETIKGEFLRMLRAKKLESNDDRQRSVIEMAAAFGIKALENGGQKL